MAEILVVDSSGTGERIKRALTGRHSIITAVDSVEAKAQLHQHHFDLVALGSISATEEFDKNEWGPANKDTPIALLIPPRESIDHLLETIKPTKVLELESLDRTQNPDLALLYELEDCLPSEKRTLNHSAEIQGKRLPSQHEETT